MIKILGARTVSSILPSAQNIPSQTATWLPPPPIRSLLRISLAQWDPHGRRRYAGALSTLTPHSSTVYSWAPTKVPSIQQRPPNIH